MTTNVPPIAWTSAGIIVPADSVILAGRQADINTAFGNVLNFTTELGAPTNPTPQAQLADSDTACISAAYQSFLYYTQQVDPAYAKGRMQDAIGRWYFMSRIGAQPTVAQCLCVGAVDVTIPVGAIAEGEDQNFYVATQAGTFDASGQMTLPFACTTPGPIPCPAGNVSIISQAIPGWDSITNVAEGVIGNATETRAAFEARRVASVQSNGQGWVAAIRGAVLAVPGVTDVYVTDNATAAPVVVGDYTIPANSVYVAVAGSAAQAAVAQAIWVKKPPGIPTSGNTTVTVINPTPTPQLPPVFSINYEIPTPLELVFAVTIANGASVPSNATTLIQNAIANIPAIITASIAGSVMTVSAVASGALSGGQVLTDGSNTLEPGTTIQRQLTGVTGSTGTYSVSIPQTVSSETMWASPPAPATHIGQKIYVSNYYAPVAALGTWAEIISLFVGSANSASSSFTGYASGTVLNVTAVASGALAANQNITDATGVVASGTTIVSQTSGTPGGIGVYNIGPPQIFASQAMFGVVATQLTQTVYIDQAPQISAANVSVTFQ